MAKYSLKATEGFCANFEVGDPILADPWVPEAAL
jgi:hypothetical protein